MIIGKRTKKNKFVINFFKVINSTIYFVGIFFTSVIIIFFIYYNTSGIKYSYSKTQFLEKFNSKILNETLGIDLNKTKDYISIIILNIINNFTSSDLENVFLELNQKTIIGIEMQRNLRKENFGEIPNDKILTYPANIKFNGENYKVKIRTKGVRNIHWKSKKTTSYKIDLIGEKRLWGLEEFAFQKPITRNYTYEYLFHKLLGYVGLTKIKYFFINLYINDQNLGVYAVEESFSKELIERQKLRNGPIFGISEEYGEVYPNVKYELYSEKYWVEEHPKMISNLYSILNNIKNGDTHINDHFELDKWAKYLAIIDLTGSYHGSLAKSVKKYYNPITALFEPIGYDLHKGAGKFDNFILLDFLQENRSQCIYLCVHKDWYLKFFLDKNGKLNFNFINLYINYLIKFADKKFIKEFINENKAQLKNFNRAIYKDNSKVDKINRVGLGYFIYDDKYLYKRSNLIKQRINSIDLNSVTISKTKDVLKYEDYEASRFPLKAETLNCKSIAEKENLYLAGKMEILLNTSCKKIKVFDHKGNYKIFDLKENIVLKSDKIPNFRNNFKNIKNYKLLSKISENNFAIDKDLIINENTLLTKETRLIIKNRNIDIRNNAIFLVEGEIEFENNKNNTSSIFSSDGSGAVIFSQNKFRFKNLIFKNLSSPKLDDLILYGGINFINSEVYLDNITISNSNDEDAMNIINSKSFLSNIKFENIFADALDIDFGKSNFNNIKCFNVNNDCLDISGAQVVGGELYVYDTKDKGISIGEGSRVNIDNITTINNRVALAVKDGSIADVNNISFKNNLYDIALFNKKKEFKLPSLNLRNVNNLNEKKILQAENTFLKIDSKILNGKLLDKEINPLLY